MVVIVTVIFFAIAGAFLYFYRKATVTTKNIMNALKEQYGNDLLLVTGCSIVRQRKRIPGFLALTREHVIYRSILKKQKGEIPLRDIIEYEVEDITHTQPRQARKYRTAKILRIDTGDNDSKRFAVAESKAVLWARALGKAIESGAR
jgi:hypothetical protein